MKLLAFHEISANVTLSTQRSFIMPSLKLIEKLIFKITHKIHGMSSLPDHIIKVITSKNCLLTMIDENRLDIFLKRYDCSEYTNR